MYGVISHSDYAAAWKKAKAKTYRSVSEAGYSYWDHVTNAASVVSFERNQDSDSLLSAEALPENSSLIGFKTFAREYPEKLFPLISKMRAEFQELFIEYYLLEKSQSFIAQAHGQIQTRIWQNLRIIEQTLGSMILLGTAPTGLVLGPIITKAGVDETPYGSLTQLILMYAISQNYALVAKAVGAPIPAIRKIFRPAITALLASKDVKAVAVGAYLRSLTHQASLTGAGLSKRCRARTRRVKTLRFTAPPGDDSPLVSFGAVSKLQDTPWCMFEISSDHRMSLIFPMLKSQGRRLFGKQAAQIFAPTNDDGELAFNYLFARCTSPTLTRGLTRVRGISEMASIYTDEGVFLHAVTIPDAEIQTMMQNHNSPAAPRIVTQDFVEILTGPAAHYCGTITGMNILSQTLRVEVRFPTGRRFVVTADPSCVRLISDAPVSKRAFWGVRLD
jgi:hypothetical protein